MPSTLLIGKRNALVEDEIYALPARLVWLQSTVALEYTAGTTGSSFVALTNSTTGVQCGGGFVRCTSAAASVFVKA